MLVLRYFDPANFADMISYPVLISVGLNDDVVHGENDCPPFAGAILRPPNRTL
jgi:cephalosporin-C deacetylase-like acetyl esterase